MTCEWELDTALAGRDWLRRKAIARMGGPKEPVNPLARLIQDAAGVIEGQELATRERVIQEQMERKRRLIRNRLALAAGVPALEAVLRRALSRLPKPAETAGARGKPQYVSAVWTSGAEVAA